MAVANITSTAQFIEILGGTPVTASAACTLGITSAGAATGPSMTGTFTWPGNPMDYTGLWVQTATTATLTYIS